MQSVPKKSKFGILQIAKYFIFVVFAAWAFHYISNLTSQEELGKSLRQIPWWAYLAALIGTTINWTLESAKWHKLINAIQFSSFSTSAKAVLSGTAVGNLLPYKIGEYLGKLYYVNNDKRALSIPLSFISSTIQLFVNLSLCIFPALYILGNKAIQNQNWIMGLSLLFGFLLLLLLSYRHPKVKNWVHEVRKNFKLLTAKVITQASLIAILRFFSFLLAYAIVLKGATHLEFTTIIPGICAVYFMQSFAPGLVLTDGPVRILLPVIVFKAMGADESTLIAASMVNYLASVILPSIFGIVFILIRKR